MNDTNTAAPAAAPSNGATDPAAPKAPVAQRSSPYPSFTIQQSLDLTKAIYDNYGSNFDVTREQTAQVLNQSTTSVQSKMSTAVQYGWLTLKPKIGYRVSDLFIKWMRPISEEQKNEAMLTSFRNPGLYQALITKFDGNVLPPANLLANILRQDHRIYDSACDEAARIFIENANFLGVLGSDKHLRLNSRTSNMEQPAPPAGEDGARQDVVVLSAEVVQPRDESGQRQKHTPPPPADPETETMVVPLKGKRRASIILPTGMTANDCDLLIDWINVYKKSMD